MDFWNEKGKREFSLTSSLHSSGEKLKNDQVNRESKSKK